MIFSLVFSFLPMNLKCCLMMHGLLVSDINAVNYCNYHEHNTSAAILWSNDASNTLLFPSTGLYSYTHQIAGLFFWFIVFIVFVSCGGYIYTSF